MSDNTKPTQIKNSFCNILKEVVLELFSFILDTKIYFRGILFGFAGRIKLISVLFIVYQRGIQSGYSSFTVVML